MCNCFGGNNRLVGPTTMQGLNVPTTIQNTTIQLSQAAIVQQSNEQDVQQQLTQQLRNQSFIQRRYSSVHR